MHGGDHPAFVAANVENSQTAHLVGMGKVLPKFGKTRVGGSLHDPIPAGERRSGVGVILGKIVESLSTDNVHAGEENTRSLTKLSWVWPIALLSLVLYSKHEPFGDARARDSVAQPGRTDQVRLGYGFAGIAKATRLRWFAEFKAELWDKQLETDVKAGKLDKLAGEAIAQFWQGNYKKL
jgi:hypothetical protein